ncbi:hypothetical protein CY0110_32015 [Crocosphaera chwakensis CCY0110]|uniref:Uncharacterized protein n=2 Tax=Crocosphaera TaxID=263510 RepID=A3IRZ1_9CHRO|nr:hypothetical protein CY0110_32015 [Crocosphaera chwakensis CCY0110]
MAADPEEQGVLFSQFEQVMDTPMSRPNLEAMVAMNVDADLAKVRQPIPSSPLTCQDIEKLFTQSHILKSKGTEFRKIDNNIWEVLYQHQTYQVTFYPDNFDEFPSLRLMTWGEPLFEKYVI